MHRPIAAFLLLALTGVGCRHAGAPSEIGGYGEYGATPAGYGGSDFSSTNAGCYGEEVFGCDACGETGSCELCAPCEPGDPCADMDVRPYDEWLCDGGDADPEVRVWEDGEIKNLNLEDAVAVYSSAEDPAAKIVTPSNRTCIYAPRFAAVRKVTRAIVEDQVDMPTPVRLDQGPEIKHGRDVAVLNEELTPVIDRTDTIRPSQYTDDVYSGGMSNATSLLIADEVVGPNNYLSIVRTGVFESSQKALVAEAMQVAIQWTHDAAVQVVSEGLAASEIVGDAKAQGVHLFDGGEAALRVCKFATPRAAKSGDEVAFTIRFDNLSEQPARDVVILDNLSPRLAYVPDSQECTLDAQFATVANEGESLRLSWSLTEPLQPGEGGAITFKCRVR